MSEYRRKRVADIIKLGLSTIIQHELRDPRIGFVTLTEVKMTPDLKHARIYFSILGDKDQVKNSLQGLNSSKNFLRREIGHRLRLRYCPTLEFCLDTSIEQGAHIEELIEQLKKERIKKNLPLFENEEKDCRDNKKKGFLSDTIPHKS